MTRLIIKIHVCGTSFGINWQTTLVVQTYPPITTDKSLWNYRHIPLGWQTNSSGTTDFSLWDYSITPCDDSFILLEQQTYHSWTADILLEQCISLGLQTHSFGRTDISLELRNFSSWSTLTPLKLQISSSRTTEFNIGSRDFSLWNYQ